jgi:hypothetical protein
MCFSFCSCELKFGALCLYVRLSFYCFQNW